MLHHVPHKLVFNLPASLYIAERGYCVRGDLCPYDHGVDPVVLDNVGLPSSVLAFPGTLLKVCSFQNVFWVPTPPGMSGIFIGNFPASRKSWKMILVVESPRP